MDLAFIDYVDFSSRLVLLPFNDEECLGAVVASYSPPPPQPKRTEQGEQSQPSTSVTKPMQEGDGERVGTPPRKEHRTKEDGWEEEKKECFTSHDEEEEEDRRFVRTPSGETAEDGNDGPDDNEEEEEFFTPSETLDEEEGARCRSVESTSKCKDGPVPKNCVSSTLAKNGTERLNSSSVESTREGDGKDPKRGEEESDTMIDPNSVVGYVLSGISPGRTDEGMEEDDDWSSVDFTFILSRIRDAPSPIILRFCPPPPPSGSSPAEEEESQGEEEEEEDGVGFCDVVIEEEVTRADEEEVVQRQQPSSRSSSPTPGDATKENEGGGGVVPFAYAVTGAKTLPPKQPNCGNRRPPAPPRIAQAANAGSLLRGRLSQWGSRLAAETSARAIELQSAIEAARGERNTGAVAVAATPKASNGCRGDATPTTASSNRTLSSSDGDEEYGGSYSEDSDEDETEAPPPCGLYLQRAGGFVHILPPSPVSSQSSSSSPLRSSSSCGSSLSSLERRNGSNASRKEKQSHLVTNSSVLIVRESPERPCPVRGGYSFQWYRSSCPSPAAGGGDFAAVSSAESGDEDDSDVSDEEGGWLPLAGATYSAFQPSATDVGYSVRCVVTIDNSCGAGSPQREGSSPEQKSSRARTVICDLPFPVSADPELFHAARQSLASSSLGCNGGGGTHFGNLAGRGNAEGRTFQLKFEIGRISSSSERKGRACTVMTIYQVSGGTAEPMHDPTQPILNATAVADPSQPRHFDLTFPSGLPKSATMLTALSLEGRFQLQAPNRVTRESLLLALGIANFRGKPSELTLNSVLFSPELPPLPDSVVPTSEYDDECGVGDTRGEEENGHDNETVHSAGSANAHGQTATDEKNEDATHIPQTTSSREGGGSISPPRDQVDEAMASELQELANELQSMRRLLAKKDDTVVDLQRRLYQSESKLAKRDNTILDLQRRLAQSESKLRSTETELGNSRRAAESGKAELRECAVSLKLAEKRIETQESMITRVKGDYTARVSSLEDRIKRQGKLEAEYEKTIKSLQNEKAVLSAAVEAREGKLSKMSDLQRTVDTMSGEITKGDAVRVELNGMFKKYSDVKVELENAKMSEQKCRDELSRTKATVRELNTSLKEEKGRTASCKVQMETFQSRSQKLKAERNSYKQKADSLSKEMARICKNGMGIDEIEKIIENQEAKMLEVSVLKAQKRKALHELDQYRSAYEQSVQAQQRAGIDGEAARAVGQRAELERVVSDLTEYVNAKEMQLETMKQVNQALTEELHMLAKANLDKNDI